MPRYLPLAMVKKEAEEKKGGGGEGVREERERKRGKVFCCSTKKKKKLNSQLSTLNSKSPILAFQVDPVGIAAADPGRRDRRDEQQGVSFLLSVLVFASWRVVFSLLLPLSKPEKNKSHPLLSSIFLLSRTTPQPPGMGHTLHWRHRGVLHAFDDRRQPVGELLFWKKFDGLTFFLLSFLSSAFLSRNQPTEKKQLNLVDAFWGIGGPILNRSQVMFSGFLILAAGLLLMLFALGAAMEGRGAEDDEDLYAGGKRGGAGRVQQQQPTTVTYGAPTGAATGVRTTGATP